MLLRGKNLVGYKKYDESVIERIHLNVNICIEGQECGEVATIADSGAASKGTKLYAGCIACHGAKGSGGIGPTLAGKSHEYIMGRLMAYKAGEKIGPQSNMMWSQASMLSDKEIHQVTEYIETL